MTAMTAEQKKNFTQAYIETELDIVSNCMTKSMVMDTFKTTDEKKIKKMLLSGIKHLKTIEEVRNCYSDTYDHCFTK